MFGKPGKHLSATGHDGAPFNQPESLSQSADEAGRREPGQQPDEEIQNLRAGRRAPQMGTGAPAVAAGRAEGQRGGDHLQSTIEDCHAGSDADETERKEAELARLAAIVQSSEDAMYTVDLNDVITNWNRGAERLYGYTAQEITGWPLTMLIPPERLEWEKCILERLLRGERAKHYETLRQRKNGSVIDVSLTVSPVVNARGQVIGTSRIARDITERKRAEEEIRAAYERESYARAEAEEANRLKDEFLAAVSHELRSPLNSILGWARMLRDKRLDEEGSARALEIIYRSARAQNQLIGDLLDVARIITGNLRLEMRMVDPVPIIEAAMDVARPAAYAKRIRLASALDPATGPVSGDANRLQQVVWNLLSNAVKFTRRRSASDAK